MNPRSTKREADVPTTSLSRWLVGWFLISALYYKTQSFVVVVVITRRFASSSVNLTN